MNRKTSHIVIDPRQLCFAWLLLLVYVPMVLLSSLHVHSRQELSVAVDCGLCQTAVHHSGHITMSVEQHDDCVLCRFLSAQVLVPSATACSVELPLAADRPQHHAAACVVRTVALPSLRAPPAIL
ncbi:MAG: hypothetical protein IKR25_13420 [Muribaculaceae bacterium]|nr:hypothetical protein [Muribaculaceae bacterium]